MRKQLHPYESRAREGYRQLLALPGRGSFRSTAINVCLNAETVRRSRAADSVGGREVPARAKGNAEIPLGDEGRIGR